jgi:hypothetical protein
VFERASKPSPRVVVEVLAATVVVTKSKQVVVEPPKRACRAMPDSTSRQDLLAGLPNAKRGPTLSKWTELLDGNMTEAGALAGGTHTQPLKEYASKSHISDVTSHSDLRQRADGNTVARSAH